MELKYDIVGYTKLEVFLMNNIALIKIKFGSISRWNRVVKT